MFGGIGIFAAQGEGDWWEQKSPEMESPGWRAAPAELGSLRCSPDRDA
jgi:hypothetical protein